MNVSLLSFIGRRCRLKSEPHRIFQVVGIDWNSNQLFLMGDSTLLRSVEKLEFIKEEEEWDD